MAANFHPGLRANSLICLELPDLVLLASAVLPDSGPKHKRKNENAAKSLT
jgi:hypothetical protein